MGQWGMKLEVWVETGGSLALSLSLSLSPSISTHTHIYIYIIYTHTSTHASMCAIIIENTYAKIKPTCPIH